MSMIRCCYCGIILIPIGVGEKAYGFMKCTGCDKEIFAVVGMGKSFKESEVTVDDKNKTINIEPEE